MNKAVVKERRIKRFLWGPIILVGILFMLLTFVIIVRISTPEDTWICQDGEWVRHGSPSMDMPMLKCEKKEVNLKNPAGNIDLSENPIGPLEIKGFFKFFSPVFNLMSEFGVMTCKWGRPPGYEDTCNSVKLEFQRMFSG